MATQLALLLLVLPSPAADVDVDERFADPSLPGWVRAPEGFTGVRVADGRATLTSDKWAFLRTRSAFDHCQVETTLTLRRAATHLHYFGSSWSAWPDPTFADGGYEAGLLVRTDGKSAYRVQLSHKYQDVALIKYPEGGYLAAVPCPVQLSKAHRLSVTARGAEVTVAVDGVERLRHVDRQRPLTSGHVALGVANGAAVEFAEVRVRKLDRGAAPAPRPHRPDFRVRTWLGGRPWIFDGPEPIVLLPTPAATTVNCVKLRPGYKPQLNWNGHWDIQNQGAFPEGTNTLSEVRTEGGGERLTASWDGRQTQGRFTTATRLAVGYDTARDTYTYDIDSRLEVAAGEPFHFRYGYDFEHHTPLDPFRWQYLVLRRKGGQLVHRPVYPVDPGPIHELEQEQGLRVWYGRHGEEMAVAPAVEYTLPEAGKRPLNTAVCAAFYDTGVSFAPETAAPGTKVHVKYRYTGYPAAEAEALFRASKVHDAPTLDPLHHYVFADEWPRLTFRQAVPMSETWIYGRTPFMTAHNTRPSYEWARDTGVGSGHALKLGPGAFGAAPLPVPKDLPAGRWCLTALCRSDNAHGPGGRVEVTVTAPKGGKAVKQVHHVGGGTFAWRPIGFAFEVSAAGSGLAVGFGNAGTSDVFFAEAEFRRLEAGAPLPTGVAVAPVDAPRVDPPVPEGALADFRMVERRGLHVLDFAAGPFGMLELGNVGWSDEDGQPALVFADNTEGRKSFPRLGNLERTYLRHHGYAGRDTLPVAVAGMHGGGFELKAFTLAAWVRPAARMGRSTHGGKGDVAGLGARRFILSLYGQEAPYRVGARLNVTDEFVADTRLDADRWYHLALTGEPTENRRWRVRLFVDGKRVHEGVSKKLEAPITIPASLVLGTELFYFHDAYYRGKIGRVTVFGRALPEAEVAVLAQR